MGNGIKSLGKVKDCNVCLDVVVVSVILLLIKVMQCNDKQSFTGEARCDCTVQTCEHVIICYSAPGGFSSLDLGSYVDLGHVLAQTSTEKCGKHLMLGWDEGSKFLHQLCRHQFFCEAVPVKNSSDEEAVSVICRCLILHCPKRSSSCCFCQTS